MGQQALETEESEAKKESTFEQKLNFLYSAIQDTQETIRFTDTKSGTVVVIIVAFIAALVTLIDKYMDFLNKQSDSSKMVLLIGSVLYGINMSVSLYLALKSINPSNNPKEHIILDEVDRNNLNKHLKLNKIARESEVNYYLTGLNKGMRFRDYIWECKDSKFSISVAQYYDSIKNVGDEGLLLSLTHEFIKLSYIKDKKCKRTQCAIKWLGACFSVALITIVLFIITYNVPNIDLSKMANKGTTNEHIIFALIIGYFIAKIISSVLYQLIRIKSNQLSLILNSIFYVIIIGSIGFLLHGLSVIDIILIFLSSMLITKIDFDGVIRKMHLQQSESSVKLSSLIHDFLHIGVLMLLIILQI